MAIPSSKKITLPLIANLLHLIVWETIITNTHAFHSAIRIIPTAPKFALRMVVTPIGPFCPFRSRFSEKDLEVDMLKLNQDTPNFAVDMARIQLDMQMGESPDVDRLLGVANGMEGSVTDWEALLRRMQDSPDYQTLEYHTLTQAHLARHGQTSEDIIVMMRWQAACLRALASDTPPPMPPVGIDLEKMIEDARNSSDTSPSPSISAMSNAEKITSTPFTGTEAAFDSPTVKEEYEALCRDHSALIQLGESYQDFDPVGKMAFLDQLEVVEERWDVFMARFSLLGQLNKQFVSQCDAFLESMSMTEADFRDLLKEAHNMMRQHAERERNIL